VRELRVARIFAALLCIALLVWCTATTPSAANLHPALPVLVFCFLVVLRPLALRMSDGKCAAQPISFFTVRISRAPPSA